MIVTALGILRGIIAVSIPIPVVLLAAGYVWFQFDKSKAVQRAIVEIVAGAELKAASQEIENQKLLTRLAEDKLTEALRRADVVKAANQTYADKLAAANVAKGSAQHEIDQIASSARSADCTLSDALYDSLFAHPDPK